MISVIAHGNRCQFNSYENCLYMFGDVFTLELLFLFFLNIQNWTKVWKHYYFFIYL